jgi:hypothetical protein
MAEGKVRNISEGDLAVVISLLASKIAEMRDELVTLQSGAVEDDAQVGAQYELQETLAQYAEILATLGKEYELGWVAGTNLPTFEMLARAQR